MTPRAVDIEAAIASRPVLKNRTPETIGPEAVAAFAILAETETGAVFAGSFEGQSAWERHPNGDELVQVIDGEATLSILIDGVTTKLEMTRGMMTIVPRGRWHRFDAPSGVSVMTMTPQPSDYALGDAPPFEMKDE